MEVSQFTYFQQVCGYECNPIPGELTYGLERLAMYVQEVDNVYDLNYNGLQDENKITYGDVFKRSEKEFSYYNFKEANTDYIFRQFKDCEDEGLRLASIGLALPAYDQCIKASHLFNILDARGVISVTERQSYIFRVRNLAKSSADAWLMNK
jgi:glycyl-tRNA synthetase alpha chain